MEFFRHNLNACKYIENNILKGARLFIRAYRYCCEGNVMGTSSKCIVASKTCFALQKLHVNDILLI